MTGMTDNDPLSRVYRRAARAKSPARIDAAILAHARNAVDARPRVARNPFSSAWAVPLSAAAVVLLSVSLVVFMSQEGLTPLSQQEVPIAPPPEKKSEAPPVAPPATSAAQKPPAPVAPERAAPPAIAMQEAPAPETPAATERFHPLAKTMPQASAPEREIRGYAAARPAAPTADIVSVQVNGKPGAYRFIVSIKSPDTGCQQYADWWEIVSEDGELLYRQLLAHSHVNEQPFGVAGGPVSIQADTAVWVRAHMRPGNYSGAAFKGSPRAGFSKAEPPAGFAETLAQSDPQPGHCEF